MLNANAVKTKMRIKKSVSTRIAMAVAFAFFLIYGISLIFPVVWCIMNSFKTRQEFLYHVWSFPKSFYVQNWIYCFMMEYNEVNILGMFMNSIIFTVGCTFASVFFSAATAYVLSKYPFPGSKAFYSLAFILMMIPMVGNTASVYKMYYDLGFYNSYHGPIITSCSGFGMCFVLLYGFFKNISWSYAEAAKIDGAGHFRIYFKVMIPLAMPGIIAMAIQGAIGVWNDYYTFYMFTPARVTISVGLYGLQSQAAYGKVSYPELFAAMMIATIPIVAVYAASQNFIIKNTSLGGVKG